MSYIDLKSLRKDKGDISQAELAEIVGTSQPFIAQIEKGKRQLNEQMITALREKYNDLDNYITDELPTPGVIQHNENGDNINGDKVLLAPADDALAAEVIRLRAEVVSKEQEIIWLRSLVEKLTINK